MSVRLAFSRFFGVRAVGVALFFSASLWLFGCGGPPPDVREVPGGAVIQEEGASSQDTATTEVTIYVPDFSQEDLVLKPRKVALPESASAPRDVLQALVDAEVDGQPLFPAGTRVMLFRVDDKGVGVVDLSPEVRKFSGSSFEEAAVVNALALTASQFQNVKSVLITVDGMELESLGGHLDLTVPAVPDKSLIAE